jgi:hypoxanthine phosphoribosyltransferase
VPLPTSPSPTDELDDGAPRFAHPAEAELARLLDRFRIAWEYEPTTFELDHDDLGRVTRAFTPDFYLPEHDLFLELTTLRQALVTKKNAKVRRLKQLHPGVRIRVLYRRDYEELAFTFGLQPLPAASA